MIKDRLPELQEYIDRYNDGENISMINYFAILDMQEPFMGDFFNQINTLRDSVNKLTELVNDLQHVLLVSQAATETKEKLEEKIYEIKSLGNNIRMTLKLMKQNQDSTKENNVYQRIIQTHIDTITEYFCTIMDRYYQSVLTYREKCRIQITCQLQKVGIEKTDDEIEEILRKGLSPEIFIQTEKARFILDRMESRHRDLLELDLI